MAKSSQQPETTDVEVEVGVETPPAAESDANADVAEMGNEAARDELVDIVARLENGQVGLEDSMGLWQRGEALAAHCATWLDEAEAKLGE